MNAMRDFLKSFVDSSVLSGLGKSAEIAARKINNLTRRRRAWYGIVNRKL
jgi:hypothetical protein